MAQEILQDVLQSYDGTILLVSHDCYFIYKLATQIWVLEDGVLHIHKGEYQLYCAETETAVVA